MHARYIDENTRIVPKYDDGLEYHLTTWNDPETNTWSLETKADNDLWYVQADFFDRTRAMRYARPCFMDMEEARGGAFVAIGAQGHKDINQAIRILDEGEIGLVERLATCGVLTERVWQADWSDKEIDFVWDYEVCSKLGLVIVDYLLLSHEWPNDGLITQWVRNLASAAAGSPGHGQ